MGDWTREAWLRYVEWQVRRQEGITEEGVERVLDHLRAIEGNGWEDIPYGKCWRVPV